MKPLAEPVALTIGNFDGVHRGHQYLLKHLASMAHKKNLRPAILCFEPHPDLVFETPGFQLLMTVDQKANHLRQCGVEFLVLQNFDRDFSKVSAQGFLCRYLASYFNIRYLLFGFDFRFGYQGEGSFLTAQDYFKNSNVVLEQEEPLLVGGDRVSSSSIRRHLCDGKVEQAMEALGRPYSLSGTVAEGQKLGRQLGFPTANLEEIQTQIPGFGVYHCSAECDGGLYTAVVNVGQRPTIQGTHPTVEAHILEFSGDLYGKSLRLSFKKKIRDEKKFDNLDKLKKQIQNDIDSVKG